MLSDYLHNDLGLKKKNKIIFRVTDSNYWLYIFKINELLVLVEDYYCLMDQYL